MLREAVSRQSADPLAHLLLNQKDLGGAAMAKSMFREAAAAFNVLFALKQRSQLGLKHLKMNQHGHILRRKPIQCPGYVFKLQTSMDFNGILS